MSLKYLFNDWIGFAHFYLVFVLLLLLLHVPGKALELRGSGVWPPLCDVILSPTPQSPGTGGEGAPFPCDPLARGDAPGRRSTEVRSFRGLCPPPSPRQSLSRKRPLPEAFCVISSSPRPWPSGPLLQVSRLCIASVSGCLLYQKPRGAERECGRPGPRSPASQPRTGFALPPNRHFPLLGDTQSRAHSAR